jgi:thiol-disulfide isomerase/thioredoxin
MTRARNGPTSSWVDLAGAQCRYDCYIPLPVAAQEFPSGSPDTAWRRRWLRWGGEIAFAVLILFAVQWWQGRDVPRGAAPEFAGQMADGRAMSLGDWRVAHPGQAVAIYFWAEWCPICKAQEGNINALRAGHAVLTVAMQSGSATEVAKVLGTRGLDWPTLIDTDGAIAARYGLHGVPALVVVDSAGDIRAVAVGYTTTVGMRLRLWVAELRA